MHEKYRRSAQGMYACGKGIISGFQNSKEQGQMSIIKRVMNFCHWPKTIGFAAAEQVPYWHCLWIPRSDAQVVSKRNAEQTDERENKSEIN